MKPDWDKLMEQFAGNKEVLVGDVDCTAAGKDLCSTHGVQGFPTIKSGDPAALDDYQGGRDFDSLEKHAKTLKPVCSPFNVDLCDADQKAKIEGLMTKPITELKDQIAAEEKKVADAGTHFDTEVKKLQEAYEKLQKDKDATIKKVKEDGSPYSMTGCTGTKRYMAPEVVLSRPDYDLKVDVYSMAMIFWYMCKGERPFEYVEPQLISVLASTRGLRPDSRAVRWGPIEHLIEQMWEEDPAKRPEATEILVTLKGVAVEPDAASAVGGWTECSLQCQCAVM